MGMLHLSLRSIYDCQIGWWTSTIFIFLVEILRPFFTPARILNVRFGKKSLTYQPILAVTDLWALLIFQLSYMSQVRERDEISSTHSSHTHTTDLKPSIAPIEVPSSAPPMLTSSRERVARWHIPVFVPVCWGPESRAGFLFRPDSGGIRPQHPWCSAFSTGRNPTSVADRKAFRSNLTGILCMYMCRSFPPYSRNYHLKLSLENPHKIAKKDGHLHKIAKKRWCQGMVQAWVGHFVTPLKCTYDEYNWRVMSQKTNKKHKQHDKHHHHGGGATRPSSGVDLMNPCRLRGGQPCAWSFRYLRRSDSIYLIN